MSSSPTVEETPLPGVLVLVPRRHRDGRGWFCESWSAAGMAAAGLEVDFVQDNHAFSCDRNTLRGLHFQAPPHAQAKLVRVTAGAVLDVCVDLRPNSPTFGKHVRVRLDDVDHDMLYIPAGMAHGFLALENNTVFAYKCSAYYAPQAERTILWNDPDLNIDWGIEAPIVSEKDRAGSRFADRAWQQ